MKNNLTAHMIVKNEEQWVWYAVQSIIDYVESIIIYDTGSTDKTVDIIRTISSSKVRFLEKGDVSARQLVDLRNEQIKKTPTSWFMLLDGDEVWPKNAMEELCELIHKVSHEISGIVVKALVPLGDLFHYQEERAGKYSLLGNVGHYNIRSYRKRPKYLWRGVYPLEAYIDEMSLSIQKKDKELIMLKNEYWHLTHLSRSTKDTHKKIKYEIGNKQHVSLPEVFFKTRPSIVPSPWLGFSTFDYLKASLFIPLYYLKRHFL